MELFKEENLFKLNGVWHWGVSNPYFFFCVKIGKSFGYFKKMSYLCNVIKTNKIMSRIKTETKSGKVVETFGLTQEQHDYAVEAVEKDLRHIADYSIEEMDEEMAEVWMEDSEDEDYKDFLSIGLEKGEILTLNCSVGQELGEIIVY